MRGWKAGKALADANTVKVDLSDFLDRQPTRYETASASRGWFHLQELGLIDRIEHPYSSKIREVELLPAGWDLTKATYPELFDPEISDNLPTCSVNE